MNKVCEERIKLLASYFNIAGAGSSHRSSMDFGEA